MADEIKPEQVSTPLRLTETALHCLQMWDTQAILFKLLEKKSSWAEHGLTLSLFFFFFPHPFWVMLLIRRKWAGDLAAGGCVKGPADLWCWSCNKEWRVSAV